MTAQSAHGTAQSAHTHFWPQPRSARLTFSDPVYEIKITCSRPLTDQEIETCVQTLQAKLYEIRQAGVGAKA